MPVGLRVASIVYEVGTPELLNAFFSTVSCRLEPLGWGSRFPELMNELYQGKLDTSKAKKVLDDVLIIRQELKQYRPDEVVWDIENPNAKPMSVNITPKITDLSNYFVTSTGRDLFDALIACLNNSMKDGRDLTIDQYQW